jgi:deoxyadenosine/deoxycytidine kinase
VNENLLLQLQSSTRTLPKFITIEGPIGVGKTTLAKRMADVFNYQTLLENADENPFLDDFYKNRQANALATQLHFLFQRAKQLEYLSSSDLFEPVHIADFMIEKDRMFAETLLSPDEYKLYSTVFDNLRLDIPRPDLVIYLQASTHTLLQRVQQRGIRSEQYINAEYLEQINQAYSRFFHFYDDAPLLIINAEQIDIVNDDQAFNSLIGYILGIQNGRHYFNPSF